MRWSHRNGTVCGYAQDTGLTDLKLINTRHGAGDREGSFDDRSGAFDLTLLPGQKYVDRLNALGYLRPGTYAVVGWPKFEVVGGLKRETKRFFDNTNPVVVYSPHFDQAVSSWHPMGLQVLDFFAGTPRLQSDPRTPRSAV